VADAAPAGDDRADPGSGRALGATLIVLCQSMQSLVFGGIGLFLPLIRRDLGISFAAAGALAAASTFVYAAMQIPSGYLADRFQPRRLFLIGLVGTNVLAFGFALQHSYWLLIANQALAGLFRALVFAPGLLLIAALFSSRRRATAMGLYVAGGFSSNIFLSTLGPVLVHPLGWRTLFLIFAGAGTVVLLAFWRLMPRTPVRVGRVGGSPLDALRLFRHRSMWLIGGIQYVRLAVAIGIAFWLPTFLVADRGRSLQTAGLVVALGAALTAPSNFLGGYVSDRLRNPLLVIGVSLTVLATTTALLPHVHSLRLLIAVIAVNAIFVQLYFGPLFAAGIELIGVESAGLASGFGNFFANLGAFTVTFGLGAVKDATGSFTVGFHALAGLCVFGLLCTAALARCSRPATSGAAV
jgi:predicted MFS family arabinose efflux permease